MATVIIHRMVRRRHRYTYLIFQKIKKLTLNKIDYAVPTELAELTLDQLTAVLAAQQFLKAAEHAGWLEECDRIKLAILFNLIPGIRKKMWAKLTAIQKLTVMNLIRWSFIARQDAKPFNSFWNDGTEYILPAENYDDTSALELSLVNIFYQAYANKNNPQPKMLFAVLGAICRPRRSDIELFKSNPATWTGDEREVFNSKLADERALIFEKCPYGLMVAIFQYWEKMNVDFIKRNDDLFNESDEAPLFQNGEGWISMLEDIAKEGVLGDFDKVCLAPAANVFMYMRHNQKKIEKMERDIERQNRE